MMESPRDRDLAFEQYVRQRSLDAAATKETWSQPARTWGFWNTEKSNMVYHLNLDPAWRKAPGRKDPYEDHLSKL
eukprot:CAMPEP_0177622706 /NCGR_PEP_ID=MMETSP0419_2-20121207/28452_1 /TAXON_ID=582737 /ORGANISM="Tetraselmis sp., Strain GSL018" /LENGTH=74 /DNA_ID=CAMNT_0019123089 /DNA_START=134 /DNA_END=358 /DNA_ORIENTATION=-